MAIAANKPYLIDVNINADQNPGGAGVWELPGLGVSKVGDRRAVSAVAISSIAYLRHGRACPGHPRLAL